MITYADVTLGNGAGATIKPDIQNGILAMYNIVDSSRTTGGITTTNTTSFGGQTFNGSQLLAIASVVSLLYGNPQPVQQWQQVPVAP